MRKDPLSPSLPDYCDQPRLVLIEMRDHLRTEKIIRLREQIEQGTYRVSAEEVAKAILQTNRFFLARGEKKTLKTRSTPQQKKA